MIRVILLIAVFSALTPLGPMGCPSSDVPPDDVFPVERGTIEVTADGPERATVGQTVRLTATVPAAADDGTLRFAWLQAGGPGVVLSKADRAQAHFAAPSLPAAKTLRFLVTVTNAAGDVGRAGVSVRVAADPDYGQGGGGSAPPSANAGPDQLVKESTQVILDGGSSTGKNLRFRWRQLSGTAVTLSGADTARATFTSPRYQAGGTNVLLFELAVTDNLNRTMTDRAQVTIKDPTISDTEVVVTTSLGSFTIELYPDKSPITVANFLQYVDDKFYDGLIIHRVIPDFVIQGGGYTPDMEEKETRDPIKNEAKKSGLSNVRGTIAMARRNEPNTATSQWFINLKDNIKGGDGLSDLDPGGVTPDGYCVFGHVIQGMDIVDKIAEVETDNNDKPVEDVVIESIRRAVKPRQGGSSADPTSTENGETKTDQ